MLEAGLAMELFQTAGFMIGGGSLEARSVRARL